MFRRKNIVGPITKLLFIFVMLLAGYVEVWACSCSYPQPVSDILRDSDAVVVAKLTIVTHGDPGVRYDGTAELRLEKVFKGSMKPGENVRLWVGDGSNCIFPFNSEDIGKSFLLYLSPPVAQYPMAYTADPPARAEPLRYATICNRSARTDHASTDLSYLDRLDELKNKTRLTATFLKGMHPGPNTSDLKLRIAGENKTLELTAKNGLFESYDLPPGRYTVSFAADPGWVIEPWALRPRDESSIGQPYINNGRHEIPIELGKAQHIELRIYLMPSAAVKGRVLSPTGQPMPRVSVCLSEKLVTPKDWCRTERTNADGDFAFSAVPAGRYYLIVNDGNRISAEQPFNAVYYPAVADPNEAKLVTVDTRVVADLVIQIPETIDLITVKGRTVFADEKPAHARDIRFLPSSEGFQFLFGKSSETGEFEITIPATARGTLSAEIYIGRTQAKTARPT